MAVRRSRSTFPLFSFVLILTNCTILAHQSAMGMDQDISKIESGAEHGAIAQQIKLGAAYLAGRGVTRDPKRAAYWYEKAANSGDPGAQLEIGFFYQAGIGVDQNAGRAAEWFERAASSGLTAAKVNLGVAYVWGLGVRKDPEFAAQLFREAAKRGDGSGACYLGDLYYFGLGVPRDTAEATHWFELGARLHNPMARFNLAMTFLDQPGHERDEEALKLLRESAQAGYVRAKHQVGLMLVRNPASEKSPGEASAMLDEAAGEGFWKSSVLLGILARDGRLGVPKNNRNAYYHFKIATLQGGESAEKMLTNDMQRMKSTLTDAEITSLNSEADEWVSKHQHPLEFASIHVRDPQNFPAFNLEAPEKDFRTGMMFGVPFSGAGQEAEGSSSPHARR